MKTKTYSNGELTITWAPDKCIHDGACVRTLPKVYNPKARPWIDIAAASTEELQKQIALCPSGALSFNMNNEAAPTVSTTKVEVMANGPLRIHGTCSVKKGDGSMEEKTNVTSFCRCGASANQPYCDGQHRKIGFEG